jgi:lipid II isoglutaminyl synthase (glutamine-hydrolysing)
VSSTAHRAAAPGLRSRLAARSAIVVGEVSRRLRLGGGSVIGGRTGLLLDPHLLRVYSQSRTVALVSGTNGKTTTTRLLAAALGGTGRVATSAAGANLPSGLAAALVAAEMGVPAVLEVDEGYLFDVAREVTPVVVALLNLSRDQLDRVSEVRMVAARWRDGLGQLEETGTLAVANADDPLVVWAARRAPKTRWVAVGQLWHADSVGCPACEGRIEFQDATNGGWSCSCGFQRPNLDAYLEDEQLVFASGERFPLRLAIPGRFNRANAAIAAVCAQALGVELTAALEAMASVRDVEGRFAVVGLEGLSVRLLLAKNPAGWTELLGLLGERSDPIAIGINSRIADGHDPSWLWDVPFERLQGRVVVATGERCADLAVRLRHAEVDHLVVRDQLAALQAAGGPNVDYVGNYTAFQQLRRALGSRGGEPADGWRAAAPVPSADEVPAPTSGSPFHESPAPNLDAPPYRRSRRQGDGASALRVVVVHPDLLGTYGDGGNGRVLAQRAKWRGIDAEMHMALSGFPLPEGADFSCLGGGEDGPQMRSSELLSTGVLERALDAGAAVLAVCAGYQVVGNSFPDAEGMSRAGVGLLDVSTTKGPARRAVGELLVHPTEDGGRVRGRPLARLTGFENHSGVTKLGPNVRPLGHVVVGVGNGAGDGTEGAVSGRVFGTYMHGPVLARNPDLADMLLELITGFPLEPLGDTEEEALRSERLRAAGGRRRGGGLS